MIKPPEVIDERLVIFKGDRCPLRYKCKRNCIAKNLIEICDFDCGIYKEAIGEENWLLQEHMSSSEIASYLSI